MRRVTTILLLILFLVPCYAEHEKEVLVKKIRGEYTITADMDVSLKEAAERARADAKRQALAQVCGERINAWERVESSAVGESFSSLNMVQVDGEVVKFEIVEEKQVPNPARPSEIIAYCIANVTVKKGVEPDPDFVAEIKGLKANYVALKDYLTFSVTPHKEGYLKVFIFENAQVGYLLYPNDKEPAFQLPAHQPTQFPMRMDYELYTDQPMETDMLVFVYTKEERPFHYSETNRQQIEEWIAKIPNDKKFVHYTSITILK